MKKTLSPVVLAFLMFSAAAQAQSPAGETSSDEPTFVEPTPQLRWSLGLGVISSPRPYVGVDNKITPIPLIELTYKKLVRAGNPGGIPLHRQPRNSLLTPGPVLFSPASTPTTRRNWQA